MASYKPDDYINNNFGDAVDFVSVYTGLGSVEPITEREFKDKAEFEKFMQDVLVIRVHSTGDLNEPPSVFIGSNNKKGWLPRDRPIKIAREMVGVLAQAQKRNFHTVRNPDGEAAEGMMIKSRQGLAYPFEVLYDPHPKGNAWLRRVTYTG